MNVDVLDRPDPIALVAERVFPASVVGVIADTHIWKGGRRTLANEVLDFFARASVDLILHAGDVNDRTVLDQLATISPVLAVRGNNDDNELCDRLADQEALQVGRVRLGLVHGHQGRSGRETAANSFDADIDIVVYGHSHLPKIERSTRGQILFNPGSPTDRRWAAHFGIGLLDCRFDQVDPSLILFSAPAELAGVDPQSMLATSAQKRSLFPPKRSDVPC